MEGKGRREEGRGNGENFDPEGTQAGVWGLKGRGAQKGKKMRGLCTGDG